MLRNRKRSFIEINIDNDTTIQVEDLYMSVQISENIKSQLINNAIQKINKELSFIRRILSYQYYILSYYISFLRVFFSKRYTIDKMICFDKFVNKSFLIDKPNVLYLYDKGIYFNKTLIPYENIIFFGTGDYTSSIDILAKITKNGDALDINLEGNTITRLILYLENSKNLCNNIKENMYYHIKYNTVDDSVINFYHTEKETKKIKEKPVQEPEPVQEIEPVQELKN
jgi:hypothetical protein